MRERENIFFIIEHISMITTLIPIDRPFVIDQAIFNGTHNEPKFASILL